MRPTHFAPFVAAFVISALAVDASADVVSPEVAACQGHQASDACIVPGGGAGLCVASSCSRINYTADGPRGTTSYPCLQCGPAPATTTASRSRSHCAVRPGTSSRERSLFALTLLALATSLTRRRR